MERLYLDGKINKTDLESVYEALFLRAVTSFEVFLEDLFYAILEGKTKYSTSRVQLLMQVKSKDVLRKIILRDKQYVTWLPFSATEERAKLYLKEGKPFSDLGNGDRSIIKTVTTIRNAIAHKSPHAIGEFRKIVIGSQSLLASEKQPAWYLRSRITARPNQSRFEVYVGELGKIAALLS